MVLPLRHLLSKGTHLASRFLCHCGAETTAAFRTLALRRQCGWPLRPLRLGHLALQICRCTTMAQLCPMAVAKSFQEMTGDVRICLVFIYSFS